MFIFHLCFWYFFFVTIGNVVACVAGVKRGRGRGNLGARERVGRTRENGEERV